MKSLFTALLFCFPQSWMVLAYPSNPPLSPPFSTHQVVQPTVFGTCHRINPAYFLLGLILKHYFMTITFVPLFEKKYLLNGGIHLISNEIK